MDKEKNVAYLFSNPNYDCLFELPRKAGYQIRRHGNLKYFFDNVNEGTKQDVIVMDIEVIPGGYPDQYIEQIKRIRGNMFNVEIGLRTIELMKEKLPETPIIVITDEVFGNYNKEAIKKSANKLITIPTTSNILLKELDYLTKL